jgi:hypothetical protein
MKKTRFTETQIVSILKQQEGGRPVRDICREHSISEVGMASIQQLKNEKDRNQPYLWGKNIHDILIITKLSKDGLFINPILNLSESKITQLKIQIFRR